MVCGQLSNFEVNKSTLSKDHKAWLDRHVVPILEAGGSVTLVGLTSRTGSPEHNEELSRERAKSVLVYLRTQAGNSFNHLISLGLGEAPATARGVPDGTEDENDRAVLIFSWEKPKPPPPKRPRKPVKKVKKIAKRSASSESMPSEGRGTIHDGADGQKVLAWIQGIEERHTMIEVPVDYAITKIVENVEIWKRFSVAGQSLRQYHTVEYSWGEWTENIEWKKVQTTYFNGKISKKNITDLTLPRKEAFRLATTPRHKLQVGP